MINLKKYKFTNEDSEWSFDFQVNGVKAFKESKSNLPGMVTFLLEQFGSEGNDFEKPMPFQQKALNYFFENEENVLNAVCEGVIQYAPQIRERYKVLPDFPDLKTIDDVKKHIVVEAIHVLGDEKDGVGYLGYNCDCTWDDEHGMGVLMHKDRCVDAGEVEIATQSFENILQDKMTTEEWSAYKEERERQKAENIANSLRWAAENEAAANETAEQPKKWWQFWK